VTVLSAGSFDVADRDHGGAPIPLGAPDGWQRDNLSCDKSRRSQMLAKDIVKIATAPARGEAKPG
jgi:hypothetical protein